MTVNGTTICEKVQTYYSRPDVPGEVTQGLFAEIGKYVIMVLAGINILREVRGSSLFMVFCHVRAHGLLI